MTNWQQQLELQQYKQQQLILLLHLISSYNKVGLYNINNKFKINFKGRWEGERGGEVQEEGRGEGEEEEKQQQLLIILLTKSVSYMKQAIVLLSW